jgi:trehalose 6-phosphate phosphatase
MLPASAVPAPDLREAAILLDIDGTILDLAATPGDVSVPPSLCMILQRLRERTSGALALVSGRPLADIDRIFSPLRFVAIGGHGAEIRIVPDAEPQRAGPFDDGVKRRFAAIAFAHPGILVEDKGYSLALHYRMAPECEKFVRESAAAIRAELADRPIELLPGKLMLEIKQTGVSKATSVRQLMTHQPFSTRRPIFIGDDVTDEDVFSIMPEFDGIAIAVGERYSAMAHHLDRPADVRCWLGRLAQIDDAGAS